MNQTPSFGPLVDTKPVVLVIETGTGAKVLRMGDKLKLQGLPTFSNDEGIVLVPPILDPVETSPTFTFSKSVEEPSVSFSSFSYLEPSQSLQDPSLESCFDPSTLDPKFEKIEDKVSVLEQEVKLIMPHVQSLSIRVHNMETSTTLPPVPTPLSLPSPTSEDIEDPTSHIYLFGKNGVPFFLEPSIQLANGYLSDSSIPGHGIGMVLGESGPSTGSPYMIGANTGGWFSRGADYAEYFEWYDGGSTLERIGYFVEMIGEKIKVADVDPIGIVSCTPAFIGDYPLQWPYMYQLDEFGKRKRGFSYIEPIHQYLTSKGLPGFFYPDIVKNQTLPLDQVLALLPSYESNIIEDIKAIQPIITDLYNPLYNPSLTYVPRSERSEWAPVGMVGKLYVRDNGQCVVNGKCDCKGGIAVPGARWHVAKRSGPNTVLIVFKYDSNVQNV